MAEVLKLREISARMKDQDNRATAHPVFVVQQRRRVYGIDPDYTDKFAWLYEGEEIAEDREQLEQFLKEYELTEEEAFEEGILQKVGYADIWEAVQPFFSLKGAEKYVRENRHNLQDPRIFVASGYRNDEWQGVRAELLEEDRDD